MSKILIIDDDVSISKALRLRLMGQGYEVVCAVDAYQGLKMAKEEAPDLIVLDIMLPGGGGEGTLKKLQMLSGTAFIPIVVLTAGKDPEVKKRVLAAGVAGFMEKPYEPTELLDTVGAILQTKGGS